MNRYFLILACLLAIFGTPALAQSTVTITAPDAAAGEKLPGQAANPGTIRIARTGSTAAALTVYIKSVGGTATLGTDYTFSPALGTWVSIPAGSSSVDFAVNVMDDWLTEGAETVRVDLDDETPSGTAPPYVLGSSDRTTVNLADNEDPLAPPRAIVSVAAVDSIGTETPGGTDPAIFRITRTNNLSPALSVRFTLGGTATAGVSYSAVPVSVTIPAGVTSVDVPIVPIDDALIEPQESVTLTLQPTDIVTVPSPAEAYVVGTPSSASASIVSDDLPPPPVVTMTSPGSNAASASGQPLTVHFTASAVDGYIVSYAVLVVGGIGASGTTNLPANTPAGTPYTGTAIVTLTGAYTSPQVAVRVTNSNGISATSAAVAVYVFNAPPPPPPPPVLPIINIYALDAEGVEVASGSPNIASFRVTHNFPATATVGFLFAIGGSAKEGVDYTLSSGAGAIAGSFLGRWFSFPAGATEAQILVNPIDDLLIESAETVTMSLYTPPFIGFNEGGPQGYDPGEFGFYYGPNYSASVNLLSNDSTPPPFPLVTITATDGAGAETTDGSDPLVFTVARNSGPTDVPLTVNYALTIPPKLTIYVTEPRPAMAQNGVDFPTLTGTVTIPAGASSTDIVVVPSYDLLIEPVETLQLTLRPSLAVWPAPGGYVLDESLVTTATIHDAALAAGTPIVTIRASDSQAYEGTAPSRTASFVIQRTGSVTGAITVAYTIAGSATNGVDYVLVPSSATIPAGSAMTVIIIDPIADSLAETIESVSLTLQTPPLAVVPPPYVLGGSGTTLRSAGATIRDIYTPPLNRYERALRLRFPSRYAVIARPVMPATAPAAGLGAAAAAPTSWTVEASTDLINWAEIGTVEGNEEVDEFVDVDAGDFDARFYRFRAVTP